MEETIILKRYITFRTGSGANKEDNNVYYSRIILASSVDDAKARFIAHLQIEDYSFDDFDAIPFDSLILKM